jgi:hydroxypyruvate isomerase
MRAARTYLHRPRRNFEAVAYADAIGVQKIHVMAGISANELAHRTYVENLSFACVTATKHGQTVQIEPLNNQDVPGYFLNTTAQAMAIIEAVAAPNLALIFDCYRVARTKRDVAKTLRTAWPTIGHIQFAAVPNRGAPNHGDWN